ncbi:7145_t:CDS:1, partial [Acaulospora colombiana]
KCPYFEDIKKKALAGGDHDSLPSKEGGCPYAAGCPHAQTHHKHTGGGDIAKCPYMNNNVKGCPYLKNESKEDKDLTK